MKKKYYYIVIVLMSFSLMTNAQQNVSLSLDDCLRMAEERNLTLRSGRIAVEKAKDLQATAFSVDKTSLTLSQDPTSGGSTDNSLTISQTFEFPTIYGARRRQLKAEKQLERTRLEVTRNELDKEVTLAYYSLLYAIERKRILRKQTAIYESFLRIANAKLNAGETGNLEWMNADRLSHENEIALSNAEGDVRIAAYDLQRWLNTDSVVFPIEDSLVIVNYQPSLSFDAMATSVAQLEEQQKKVGEYSLKVARQGFLPDISLSARTQMVISGFNPYGVDRSLYDKGNFMGFEIGLSVPLFYGSQRAKVKAAKHDIAIAEAQMQSQIQTMNSLYHKAYEEYEKAKVSLEYYRTGGAAQADKIERISQMAYENGEIGYVEYVQNLQTALDIHNQYATAINNYNQTVIKLKYIKGN